MLKKQQPDQGADNDIILNSNTYNKLKLKTCKTNKGQRDLT